MSWPPKAHARLRVAAPLLVVAVVSACAVGPTYIKPAAPDVGYVAQPNTTIAGAPAAAGSGGSQQSLQYGAAVAPRWFEGFGSPALDRLVDEALAHNPDLTAAHATLREAQYNLQAINGIFYPQITAGLDASRQRVSPATGRPGVYNLYTGEVNVSYYPDVFGLNRLVARGGQAQVDVARDQLSAARLALDGNVVAAAINLASVEEQIDAVKTSIADLESVVELTRKRYQLGAESQLGLLSQQGVLASTQARLPMLEQSRDALRHLLATYLGRFPSEAEGLAIPKLAELHLPETLPVDLPSTLVRARPDIRAAEAQLRAANALVGERVAAMYPRLQLTGSYGGQSIDTNLFNAASRIWSVAATLAAPIFEGGTLRAQRDAAQAAYDSLFATYQTAVLGAFRNVADSLRALEHDAAALDAAARASNSAHDAAALARAQYEAGAIDYLAMLTSEVQYENARIAQIQAQAQRYVDTTALYVSLGGGEWQPPNANPTTPVATETEAHP